MDGAIVAIVSLLVGALAIHVGARVVLSGEPEFTDALVAAVVGAAVYSVLGFLGAAPGVGPLLLLVLWVGVVNWRYPGGWLRAAAIGLVAWVAAVGVLWLLSTVGAVDVSAVGVPGV